MDTKKQKRIRALKIRLEAERISWSKWHKNATVKKETKTK